MVVVVDLIEAGEAAAPSVDVAEGEALGAGEVEPLPLRRVWKIWTQTWKRTMQKPCRRTRGVPNSLDFFLELSRPK